MTVQVKDLLIGQQITAGDQPTLEMIELMQRLVEAVRELQAANTALEARVAALEVFHP